jgi:hypothetical protein
MMNGDDCFKPIESQIVWGVIGITPLINEEDL